MGDNIFIDEQMMRRALQLALCGEGFTSPNPMVGAVIVDADNRIIGEGYHRRWGEAHAEVNAINSVADKSLLPQSTVYVTLEPCSHYGKTPPCAKLLIDCAVKKVVVGTVDPFASVSGRGIDMLKNAGIEVVTGVLEKECRDLNRRFMLAHSRKRAYIVLKWAQSADGFIAHADGAPVPFSTPLTKVLMHRERSRADAILVGSGTVLSDNPSLTCRLWPSRSLRPIVVDRRRRVDTSYTVASNPETIILHGDTSPRNIAHTLYADYGVTSLLVEGGAELLNQFIADDLYDEVRIEVSPQSLGTGIPAPAFNIAEITPDIVGDNKIFLKRR